MLSARSIIPAMALRAAALSFPPSSIWFLPSFTMRMCMCSPLPALPTVIFGANVTLSPISYARFLIAHFASMSWSAAFSAYTGRNSISFCS